MPPAGLASVIVCFGHFPGSLADGNDDVVDWAGAWQTTLWSWHLQLGQSHRNGNCFWTASQMGFSDKHKFKITS